MRPAFPASDYYEASAPPGAVSRRRACPYAAPDGRGQGDTGRFPRSSSSRSTGEAPSSTPAASPRLRRRPSPWPPSPDFRDPARSSPPEMRDGCAPQTSPDPPGSSWRRVKRRNNTGFSRIPSRLAHHARPIRQSWTDVTLSRLLPPSPATPGSGFLQLQSAATTANRWWPFTSIRK